MSVAGPVERPDEELRGEGVVGVSVRHVVLSRRAKGGAGLVSGEEWVVRIRPPALVVLVVLSVAVALVLGVFAGVAWGAPSEHPLEIVPGSFHVETSVDGVPSGEAGAHADLTVSFDLAHETTGLLGSFNDARTAIIELPPGLLGNSTAVPTCMAAELVGNDAVGEPGNPECVPASQVGTITFEAHITKPSFETITLPVYNMRATSFGVAAQFGFNVLGTVVQVSDASLRAGDSGITVTSPNIEKIGEFRKASFTTWGLPASPIHDAERGRECFSSESSCFSGGKPANWPVKPFLSNPTSCGEAHVARIRSDSWEQPEAWSTAETVLLPATIDCGRVPFDPSIAVQPTTRSAESPSGLDVSLLVPQVQAWEYPTGVASAALKNSVVKLPVGYTANPSMASGVGVCTHAQFEAETSSSPPGAGCPEESKIGTVEVDTPLLAEKLSGAAYIAKPFENPWGALLGLYIVVKSPERGIVVRLAGHIEPDPVTGQLTTIFEDSPQVAFSRFTLKLHQGPTSPLVSPPVCGTYVAQAELTPWSSEFSDRILSPPFVVERGIGGGPCPSGGVPPFRPGILAGTINNNAGAYTPMSIHITRNDGEQEIVRFTSILPAGLTANLTGVAFCPDADIQAAKLVSGAQEERASSCPQASEIGHTLAGAGVGGVLAYTPGKVYFAGPYNGAPFSIVAITPAKVGPFDLGTVVVREALNIDPVTARVTVDAKASDPIPHIMKGIVIHVRDLRVYIDRPNFMINPTSCDPLAFVATVSGGGADPSNPADAIPVTVSSRFQLANCSNLAFKPHFTVQTNGRTSRKNGASLTVKLTYPKAPQGTQTNIRSVKVSLPRQMPSRLTTLQKACPDAVFNINPAACPPASHVGQAVAHTPILPVPLAGPAYFVSHGGAKFPELIVVLQGYGIVLQLHGETFINKKGITSSTFKTVPDDPIGSFQLTLPQGPDSALAANVNLCGAKLRMPTTFTAQNGNTIHQNTPIAVRGCH
jgi:hypothetical protein